MNFLNKIKQITVILFFLIEIISQAETNLLSDGGFEQVRKNALIEWRENTSFKFESIEVIQGDPRFVRSGDYAIKLVQNEIDSVKEKFGALCTYSSVPIEPLTEYTMSLWAKGEGKVGVSVYTYTGSGKTESNKGLSASIALVKNRLGSERYNSIDGNDEWKECSYTFVLKKDDTSVQRIRFVIEARGTIYVDDCSFIKKSEEKVQLTRPMWNWALIWKSKVLTDVR